MLGNPRKVGQPAPYKPIQGSRGILPGRSVCQNCGSLPGGDLGDCPPGGTSGIFSPMRDCSHDRWREGNHWSTLLYFCRLAWNPFDLLDLAVPQLVRRLRLSYPSYWGATSPGLGKIELNVLGSIYSTSVLCRVTCRCGMVEFKTLSRWFCSRLWG